MILCLLGRQVVPIRPDLMGLCMGAGSVVEWRKSCSDPGRTNNLERSCHLRPCAVQEPWRAGVVILRLQEGEGEGREEVESPSVALCPTRGPRHLQAASQSVRRGGT